MSLIMAVMGLYRARLSWPMQNGSLCGRRGAEVKARGARMGGDEWKRVSRESVY
jgi:hypothetical protein